MVVNGRQRIFLRLFKTHGEETGLSGFARGSVQRASGGFGTKIVLEMTGLDLSTGLLELVTLRSMRSTSRCPTGPWRVRLETAQGTAQQTGRAVCRAAGPNNRGEDG